jgi:signal transduction histidine kinase
VSTSTTRRRRDGHRIRVRRAKGSERTSEDHQDDRDGIGDRDHGNHRIATPLPDAVEIAAYYIVAEALSNAAKHSRATKVTICAHDKDAKLHLLVTDNGIGGAKSGKGSGLVGLNDRVEALGGKMTITSVPGSGTSLSVTIPVNTLHAVWSSTSKTQSVLVLQ